ncbi:retinol dehydrogenase 11-like [Clytia hemisphaerica]|uniref:retinol dehydrogenase 11-like n=1 Tax=Clytia hemisphaerica TaxID=252671 RepID=UPI0034D6DD10
MGIMCCISNSWAVAAVFVGLVVLLVKYFQPGRCNSKARLDGKIAIVTGANTGIGKETVKDFVNRGAIVILACRTVSKGEDAKKDIVADTGASPDKIHVRQLDLGSLKSVRKFAESFLAEFPKLNILVNNAGVMLCPYSLTEDGFEQHFGVNHLGHFALTNLLLTRIKESGPKTRIVTLSSNGHKLAYYNMQDLLWKENKYSDGYAYNQSKLCNILFTKELHKRLADTDITTYAVHPGVVNTDLTRHYPRLEYVLKIGYPYIFKYFIKTPNDGAQTSIYCSVQEGIENLSGEYFADCARINSHKWAYDVEKQKELWKISEDLTKITYPL